MRRASQRGGVPAQAVLRFLEDVLLTDTPRQATRILGFPQEGVDPECHLLHSILSTLANSRFARTQPEVYCDSLHTLHQLTHHGFYEADLSRLVMEGGSFCEDLFHAVVVANDVCEELQKATGLVVKVVRYRADMYGVLSECLRFVRGETDTHRNVLIEIFGSFFPEGGLSTIQGDFKTVQALVNSGGQSNEALQQINRLFASMAAFVQHSILNHWELFKMYCPHALGVTALLIGLATQISLATLQTQSYEKMNESLTLMSYTILAKFREEVSVNADFMEEMLRDTDLVGRSYKMIYAVDKRMSETLRTHIFAAFRGVLLVAVGLPDTSNFKSRIASDVMEKTPSTTAILSEHLDLTLEPRDLHVVLFELMSLHHEFCTDESHRPRSEAFTEAVQTTLPVLVMRLSSATQPSQQDIAFVDAQIVYLSKIATPAPPARLRHAVAGPAATNKPLITKAMDIVSESRFFAILMKQWPPEGDHEVDRVRSLQPTIRLGLHLILNILHRDQRDVAIHESICRIFEQHLSEFQTALKMGTPRRIAQRDWRPFASDEEIAQLIEHMIRNSAVQHKPQLLEQLSPFCPSSQSRIRL